MSLAGQARRARKSALFFARHALAAGEAGDRPECVRLGAWAMRKNGRAKLARAVLTLS